MLHWALVAELEDLFKAKKRHEDGATWTRGDGSEWRYGPDGKPQRVKRGRGATSEPKPSRKKREPATHKVRTASGHREVKTVAQHGLYAVNGQRGEYVVTFLPTGTSLPKKLPNKAAAIEFAKHMHEHAGDVGAGSAFGRHPNDEALRVMHQAFKAFR